MQSFLTSWFTAEQQALDAGELDPHQPGEAPASYKAQWSMLLEQANQGELEHWQATPPGTLALILLYSAVPAKLGLPYQERRHFKARALCLNGIRRGFDTQLDLGGRHGFYTPLYHSWLDEDKALLARLLAGMRAIAADEDPARCRLALWQQWHTQAMPILAATDSQSID
ncbi:DUF924 family protein [Shewanella litorisediminis]|uniref:DUF924 family protein n=1 Tax=Shewanella litorisediminis TaxID=1173586 RepID=A0ABX7G0F6_9GAMM|nr:DUF924 family protein [Shewanella litorisediminis]MCL2918194.1 DUF924 family protein [Shewanella litorisediminis]QRH00753.1 DUF924 family protein [Shewanella litorisediminis]